MPTLYLNHDSIWTWQELLEHFSSVWFWVILYQMCNYSAPNYSVLNSLACFPKQYNHIVQLTLWTKKLLWEERPLTKANQSLYSSMRITNVKSGASADFSLWFCFSASSFDYVKEIKFVTKAETISSCFQQNHISLLTPKQSSVFTGLRRMWVRCVVSKTKSQGHNSKQQIIVLWIHSWCLLRNCPKC